MYEADMALAFEYHLNTEYSFGPSFQAQLAEYLSISYMEYINSQNLSVKESDVGFDLNGDGALDSTITLTIEHDINAHPETNGYYGTYLDIYLAEFTQNLQWYMDNLDYADGWTWFDSDGTAMSADAVAAMTTVEKSQAFIEGRYTKSIAGGMGDLPNGELPGNISGMPNGGPNGTPPDGELPGNMGESMPNWEPGGNEVGTPDEGTTQSATGKIDSASYTSYDEMVTSFREDIEEVYA
ncbi:MAG: hypothetical protein LBU32_05805 [Clostridiales bacterium]|nr:hypothetical protein [Clostridiales bacterium]